MNILSIKYFMVVVPLCCFIGCKSNTDNTNKPNIEQQIVESTSVDANEKKTMPSTTSQKPTAQRKIEEKKAKFYQNEIEIKKLYSRRGNSPTFSDPQWFEWVNFGDEKMEIGNYEYAITYYTRAIDILPNNQEAYAKRGFAKSYLQNYKGAIEDLDKAIEINTKIISKDNSNGEIQLALYYGRAEVKLFSGDAVGAIEDCNNAINSNNKYGSAYLLKGKINLISNQINEGCINLRRAYALGQYDALKDLNQFCLVNFDEKSKDILKNQVKKSGVQEIYLIHVTPEDWGCEKQVIWNSAAEKVYGYTECRMELTYKGIKTVEEVIFDKFGIPPYSDDILYELWTNKLVKGVDKSNLIYEYWNNGKVYVKYRNQ